MLLLLEAGAQVRAHLTQCLACCPPHVRLGIPKPLQPCDTLPSATKTERWRKLAWHPKSREIQLLCAPGDRLLQRTHQQTPVATIMAARAHHREAAACHRPRRLALGVRGRGMGPPADTWRPGTPGDAAWP